MTTQNDGIIKRKKSFIIFLDTLGTILRILSKEEVGEFMHLIYEYQTTGAIKQELDKSMQLAIAPFLLQFERDHEKYIERCKTNKTNRNGGS